MPERNLLPKDCLNFNTCNAAICPVDARWRTSVHLRGEKVCPYLLATGKAGVEERLGDDPVFRECLTQLPEVVARHPDIGRKVEQAAKYGFKGDHRRGKRIGEQAVQKDAADTVDAEIDQEAA